MASSLDHSDYESDESIEPCLDLYLSGINVGVFTMDVTPLPATTIGEIRQELANILNLTPDTLLISYNKLRPSDNIVVKDYLEDLKILNETQTLIIIIKASEEPMVAMLLQQKILDKSVPKETKRVIFEDMNPVRETQLTVFISPLQKYIDKVFQ